MLRWLRVVEALQKFECCAAAYRSVIAQRDKIASLPGAPRYFVGTIHQNRSRWYSHIKYYLNQPCENSEQVVSEY